MVNRLDISEVRGVLISDVWANGQADISGYRVAFATKYVCYLTKTELVNQCLLLVKCSLTSQLINFSFLLLFPFDCATPSKLPLEIFQNDKI